MTERNGPDHEEFTVQEAPLKLLIEAFETAALLCKDPEAGREGLRKGGGSLLPRIPAEAIMTELATRIPRLNEDAFGQVRTSVTEVTDSFRELRLPVPFVMQMGLIDLNIAVARTEGARAMAAHKKPSRVRDYGPL